MRNTLSIWAALSAMLLAGPTRAAEKLNDGLYAEINTTKGKIILRLEFEKTPLTVANFVGLAEGKKDSNKPKGTKFYDGLAFHRVIPNFMVQGGCPLGTGTGDPGYKFADEIDATLKHSGPGILSMANSGPGTNGSQFFITHKATPWLDGKHTVFGKVVGANDQKVVNAIVKGDKIKTVKILRVGAKAKVFKADQAAFVTLENGKDDRAMAKFKAQMAKDNQLAAAKIAEVAKANPGAKDIKTKSGLRYLVTKAGAGVGAAKGKTATVHIVLSLPSGKVLDDTRKSGKPAPIPVGAPLRIKGLAEGLEGIKKGERRLLVVPHDLAFGKAGSGGAIPPYSTLIIDIECIEIK
jgi:peptidylprolyl isomerase